MSTKTFYVTTPIYYVNDRPHIGHVYTTTIADVVARYHRLRGDDVFFLTGVDEHAAKVVDAAAQRGLTPQQWADQNAAVFKQTFERLGMTHNDFVRTSDDRHKRKVREYVAALLKTGDVYLGEYEGWYDAGQEEYVTESNAAANQFKSPINGKPLVRKKEKNYFFRLSAYRAALQEHFTKHPDFVQPEARRNEILNRIAEMVDVPISRSGTGGWGIPVPGDEAQSIYVWIDALFNYLSFVDTDNDPELKKTLGDRRHYWRSGAVHLIAKDILWFHAAIWPALLLALAKCPGYEWVALPRQVYSHSFWISEGQKMSKSLGNFIDLEKIDKYIATFSLDALRYFLASNGPLGTTDSDFAEAKFIEVYNTDLANTLGNCYSRVTNMTHRYFGGKLPEPLSSLVKDVTIDDQTHVLGSKADQSPFKTELILVLTSHRALMSQFNLAGACNNIRSLIRAIDTYIENTSPFKLAKDPAKLPEVGTILYNCAEALRIASVLLWPVIPAKVEELWRRLGCDYAEHMKANGGRGELEKWVVWGQLKPGTTIAQGDPLFPRYTPPKA